MISFIEQNILTIISILFGIIGIIISVIVTLRSRIQIYPIIYYENFREVSKLSDSNRKVKVYFDKFEVPQVTTTRIWFWNKGNRPIKKEDIPENDPLIFKINDSSSEDINILDYEILKSTKLSSNISLTPIKNKPYLKLNFDFLDHNDGFVFDVQHTGSVESSIQLDGVILGPKKKTKIIKNVVGEVPTKLYHRAKKKSIMFKISTTLFLLIFLSILSLIFPNNIKNYELNNNEIKNILTKVLLEENIKDSTKIEIIINKTLSEVKKKSNSLSTILVSISLFSLLFLFSFFYIMNFRDNFPKNLDIYKLEIQKPNKSLNTEFATRGTNSVSEKVVAK